MSNKAYINTYEYNQHYYHSRYRRILLFKKYNNLADNFIKKNYSIHSFKKKNEISKLQQKPAYYWMLMNSAIILLFYFLLIAQNFETVNF